jgi:hypothetical protein
MKIEWTETKEHKFISEKVGPFVATVEPYSAWTEGLIKWTAVIERPDNPHDGRWEWDSSFDYAEEACDACNEIMMIVKGSKFGRPHNVNDLYDL